MSEHLNDLQLNRLHDGQVTAADRAVFTAHLAACAMCTSRLAELAELSRSIALAPLPVLSQIARARLRRNVLAATERGLIRLAEVFSGMAAAVLIGGLLWLSRTSVSAKTSPMVTASIETAPPWVDTPTPGVPKIDSVTNTPAARWYLADTSSHVEESL